MGDDTLCSDEHQFICKAKKIGGYSTSTNGPEPTTTKEDHTTTTKKQETTTKEEHTTTTKKQPTTTKEQLTTSTSKAPISTTNKESGIKCYYCKHLEGDCNVNIAGEIVECQMNSPRENHHGDACFVGYSVLSNGTANHWWRGCRVYTDEMLGCREHPFTKDGEKYLVEECVCKTNECNEKMQSVTSSTTEGWTTEITTTASK